MYKKYALAILLTMIPATCLSDTTQPKIYQSPNAQPTADFYPFPTHESLLDLAKKVLQKSEPDGSTILSCLEQFVTYAQTLHQPQTYLRSTFKAFSNKLKSVEYISPYQFLNFLDRLFTHLDPHMKPEKSHVHLRNSMIADGSTFDRFKTVTNNLLYIKFSTEYDSFKEDPYSFLEQISDNITQIAQEEVRIELLRQSLVRFLEIALSKLVWNYADQEKTWDVTKKISQKLGQLVERNILSDVNDLDDLFWSLIHRYCYILDLTTGMMPVHTYQLIRDDIATNRILLLELDEQDDFIERKADCLNRTLIQAQARTRAQQQGIITK